MQTDPRILQLKMQLEQLAMDQKRFSDKIQNLQKELDFLSETQDQSSIRLPKAEHSKEQPEIAKIPASKENEKWVVSAPSQNIFSNKKTVEKAKTPSVFEEFLESFSQVESLIGTSIISKIGILVLLFGVIIGMKYSIENNLVPPIVRIISGYVMSLALLLTGMKLKEKYLNFSAILVGGSIAIMYFVTFSAHEFYGIFSKYLSFGLMFVFTVFSVIAALNFNKPIIAHLGIVGAYVLWYCFLLP
ncbi:MAG: hypothetical protein C4K58_05755 [Flavobacteriaceae bacterium]|nr:MAG: hypothetical protein C4K58_05755 [Flavobacteriaceae bacterium]